MGNKPSRKRCGKYDEYDNVSSGFHSQWSSDLFHCVLFCLLYSFQKEKTAYTDQKKYFLLFFQDKKQTLSLKVCSLTYRTFANFLAGQCLEAVILGSMFVVTLSILRMPYALLIGIFNCVYGINSYFWSLHRMCSRKLF